MCITSPLELTEIDDLASEFNIKVIIQKVTASGRAKETESYFKYQSFDPGVLDQVCPNSGTLSYYPEKGYSVCCSNILFNIKSENIENISSCKFKYHLNSNFYNEVTRKTFRERLLEKGIEYSSQGLNPQYSSHCELCEDIILNRNIK
ncbi:MAG: hypothetical protein ABIA04_04085 [Pseudomonadota bacterium]